jgi:diguanylate cyclase (GGDEF)-like protein/PAS domain S-box-containing protein
MREQTRVIFLSTISIVMMAAAIATTSWKLYSVAIEEERARLSEFAQSQARTIEAVATYDRKEGRLLGRSITDSTAMTLSQFRDAYRNFTGFGKTGEFTLARRKGDQIVFILHHRHEAVEQPPAVPFASTLAEPMRRALSGHSGTIVGLDYRDETVLAAFEPVAVLDLGVVAKIDLAEIRAPFIRAGGVVTAIAALLSVVGTFFFIRITGPMVKKIHESEAKFRSLFESSNDAFMVLDEKCFLDCNAATLRMFGCTNREEFCGTHPAEWSPPVQEDGRDSMQAADNKIAEALSGGRNLFKWTHRRLNGEDFPAEVLLTPMVLAGKKVLQATVRDITERVKNERQLQHFAQFDFLTGLPNRRLLTDRLKQALAQARRNDDHVAILFIDLDRVKFINDTLGHDSGDKLLQLAADRLQNCLRETDTVARFDGDEFVVILAGMASADVISEISRKILYVIEKSFELDSQEVFISASMGISVFPDDGENPQDLLKQADMAMFRAKAGGGNDYQFYTSAMNDHAMKQLSLGNKLHHALVNDEFRLHYQPQVNAATGQVFGVEALIRWQHPEFGLVPPLDFIPLLEETGMIVAVGEWVLQTACAQAVEWEKQGLLPLRMAVNVSGKQLKSSGLADCVRRVLEDTGLAPDRLELEITESVALHDCNEYIQTTKAIVATGVRLAIDDFGTGNSSLVNLQKLPFHTLKVDQSFVRAVPSDPDHAALLKGILAMAQGLNIEVVAEGVETQEQLAFLQAHGCESIQGFLFSKPMPAEEMGQFLECAGCSFATGA